MPTETYRAASDSDDSDDDSPETIVLCPGTFRPDDDAFQLSSDENREAAFCSVALPSPPPEMKNIMLGTQEPVQKITTPVRPNDHEFMPSPIVQQAPHFAPPQVPPSPPPQSKTAQTAPPSGELVSYLRFPEQPSPPPAGTGGGEEDEDPVIFFETKLLNKTGDVGLQQNCIAEFEAYVVSLDHCAFQGMLPSYEAHKMWCKEFNATWGPAGNNACRFVNAKRMGEYLHNYFGFEWNEDAGLTQNAEQQNAPDAAGGYIFRESSAGQYIVLQQGNNGQTFNSPPLWSPPPRPAPAPLTQQHGGKQGRRGNHKPYGGHQDMWKDDKQQRVAAVTVP